MHKGGGRMEQEQESREDGGCIREDASGRMEDGIENREGEECIREDGAWSMVWCHVMGTRGSVWGRKKGRMMSWGLTT